MQLNKRLITISLCAMAAAVILGVVLFFAFRGPTSEHEDDPGDVDTEQTMPVNDDNVPPAPDDDDHKQDLSNPVYPTAYVPYDMANGMYRLVGGETYVNAEGKACYSTKTNELIYWAFGSNGLFRASVDFQGADRSLHAILTAIGNGSMFNAENGEITAIYIFPGTTEDTKKDLSALPEGALKDIDVVLAINPSTSKEAGMATATNTGLLLPGFLTSFKVYLGGDYVLENSERTPTFLTVDDNGLVTVNKGAGEGATGRILADFGNDGYRVFTFTLLRDGTIETLFETTVEASSQGGNRPGGNRPGGGMTGAPVPDGVYTWSNGRLRCADTGVVLMKNESLGWMIINGENRNLIEDTTVITILETVSQNDAVEIIGGKVAGIIENGSVNAGGGRNPGGNQGGGNQGGGGSGMTGAPVPDGDYALSSTGRFRCADTGVIVMKNESLGWMIINGENRNLVEDEAVIEKLEEALAAGKGVSIADGQFVKFFEGGGSGGSGGNGGGGSGSRPSGGGGGGSGMTSAPIPDGVYTLTTNGGFRCAATGVNVTRNASLGWMWMIGNNGNRNLVEGQAVIEKLEEALVEGKGVKIENGEFVEFVEGGNQGGNQGGNTQRLTIPSGDWEVKQEGGVQPAAAGIPAPITGVTNYYLPDSRSFLMISAPVTYADGGSYYLRGINGGAEGCELHNTTSGWTLTDKDKKTSAVKVSDEARAFLDYIKDSGAEYADKKFTFTRTEGSEEEDGRFTLPTDSGEKITVRQGTYTVLQGTLDGTTFQYLSNGIVALKNDGANWFIGANVLEFKLITDDIVEKCDELMQALKDLDSSAFAVGDKYKYNGAAFEKIVIETPSPEIPEGEWTWTGSYLSSVTVKNHNLRYDRASDSWSLYQGGTVLGVITNQATIASLNAIRNDKCEAGTVVVYANGVFTIQSASNCGCEMCGDDCKCDEGEDCGCGKCGSEVEPDQIVPDGTYTLSEDSYEDADAVVKNDNGDTLIKSGDTWYVYREDDDNVEITDETILDALNELLDDDSDRTEVVIRNGKLAPTPQKIPTDTYSVSYNKGQTDSQSFYYLTNGTVSLRYMKQNSTWGVKFGSSGSYAAITAENVADSDAVLNALSAAFGTGADFTSDNVNDEYVFNGTEFIKVEDMLTKLTGTYTYDDTENVLTRDDNVKLKQEENGAWQVAFDGTSFEDVTDEDALTALNEPEDIEFEAVKEYVLSKTGWAEKPETTGQEVPTGTYTVKQRGNSNQSYRYLVNDTVEIRYVRDSDNPSNSAWNISFSGGANTAPTDYAPITEENVTNSTAVLNALNTAFGTSANKDNLNTDNVGDEYTFDGNAFKLKDSEVTTSTNIPRGEWTVTASGSNFYLAGSEDAQGYSLRYTQSGWTLYRGSTTQDVNAPDSIIDFLNDVRSGSKGEAGTVYVFDGSTFTPKDGGGTITVSLYDADRLREIGVVVKDDDDGDDDERADDKRFDDDFDDDDESQDNEDNAETDAETVGEDEDGGGES